MIPYYCGVKANQKGIFKVHAEGCSYLQTKEKYIFLGQFNDCHQALKSAKLKHPYRMFDGCRHCTPDCQEW